MGQKSRRDTLKTLRGDSLRDVVVTAQESRGLSTASVIKKHAMAHLQPSSFSDLLELLPGGRSKDPVLNAPNTISLREAGTMSGYSTTSLGTSFVIDGAPISTNANRQYVSGAWDGAATSRDFVNSGVDMRTISTDDIESVEIVRGIPSVEYGDLTSGLVKIERRRGGNSLNTRLKADMGSKLFYLAKGFDWTKRRLTLNLSADWLDAKADPRNRLENYKRLTLSARLNKRWTTTRLNSSLAVNLDYSGSFDNEKVDPDLNNHVEDSYKSEYNRWALAVNGDLKNRSHSSWWKSLRLSFNTSYSRDFIRRTGLVQLSRTMAAPNTTVDGETDGVILPYKYVATHEVDGRPLSLFAKVAAEFQIPSEKIVNSLLVGAEWRSDRNFGHGQLYDVTRPLYPSSIATRPRDLASIPSEVIASLFAEEHVVIPLGKSRVDLTAGVRAAQMLNLDRGYAMRGRWYADPRLNLALSLPRFFVGETPVTVRLLGGVGEHTKMPTIEQLYPDAAYIDLIQLNYFHENVAYRRINLRTYVVDVTNKSLTPARNLKLETGFDVSVGGNRLSVTLFRENMTSGFRSQTSYRPYEYKLYDASGVDATALTSQPSLDDMPYTLVADMRGYSQYTNGSQTLKEGVELTLSTVRLPVVLTRLTVSGAWFRTTYRNSQVETYRPSVVINGSQLQLVGYYKDDGGRVNQLMNTNFTFDTDVPKLRLGFSLTAQCMWFTLSRQLRVSNFPDYYMDESGEFHDWKSGDEHDSRLVYLVRDNTESFYRTNRVPFSMNVNFKVTKKLLGDRMNVALFCNKLWDYNPSYKSGTTTIRRHVTPYFGLEANFVF